MVNINNDQFLLPLHYCKGLHGANNFFFNSCFRLEQVFPDPRTCLLNQKLQLLNCCISRRIAREKRAMKPVDEDSDSDVDDEFFDCSSDAEGNDEEPRRRKVKHMPWDKPTGRLARHGKYF